MSEWQNYSMLTDDKIPEYFKENSFGQQRNLFILGEGFDSRMCIGLKTIKEYLHDLTIYKIHYAESKDSQSKLYEDLIESNLKEYCTLVNGFKTLEYNLKMWMGDSEERYVAEIEATRFVKDNYDLFNEFNNIIIDISALPQSIYYPLLIKLCKDWLDKKRIYLIACENYMTDMNTLPVELAETAHQMHGFMGTGNPANEECVVWFPVLGEINPNILQKYYDYLQRTYHKIDEICPVVPFPSVDVRRLDKIVDGYRKLLFSQWQIEKENLIYVAENNSFQVYRKLYETAQHYDKVMTPIGKCRFVFSTITSKLMGIGALLAAMELKNNNFSVEFLNISNKGYRLANSTDKLFSKVYCLCLSDNGL